MRHQLALDTELARLLPLHSPAARWNRELRTVVGDPDFLCVLFESQDPRVARAAFDAADAQIRQLPGLIVEDAYPGDFVQRYGPLLVPSGDLQELLEVIIAWKAEASPLSLGLETPSDVSPEAQAAARDALDYFTRAPEVHQSADGRAVGMLLRSDQPVVGLDSIRALIGRLEPIVSQTAQRFGVQGSITGTLRSRVDINDTILSDLQVAGTIAAAAVLLILALGFRSLRILPVVLLPVGAGLLVSFALVPYLVGELSSVTSFLLMILFGMSAEWSIHLVSRFRDEQESRPLEHALFETFRSTGRTIVTSALATALGTGILVLSEFRGFREYGLTAGCSMLVLFVSMFTVLPSALVLGHRLGLVQPWKRRPRSRPFDAVPSRGVTLVLGGLVLSCIAAAWTGLRFDYDFSELVTSVPGLEEANARQRIGLLASPLCHLDRDAMATVPGMSVPESRAIDAAHSRPRASGKSRNAS